MRPSCGRPFSEALISGYLDGFLDPADEQRVQRHLEQCSACRGILEELVELQSALKVSPFRESPVPRWLFERRPPPPAVNLPSRAEWFF